MRRRSSFLTLGLLFVALSATASPARAEDDPRAERLFREGREAVSRGDWATGCARFVSSLELNHRAGPLLNLAACEEHQGSLVAALNHWKEGLALLPKGDDRLAITRGRIDALDKRVPRLTLRLPADAPAGAVVALDGAPLPAGALGAARLVDPREHVVVVTAGASSMRSSVTLGEGERRELVIGAIAGAAPVPSAGPGQPAAPEAPSGARTAGFAIGGVGLGSLAVGLTFGGLTLAKKSAVDKACAHPATCTTAANRDAASAGKTFSAVSTATFVIGAAGLATGIVLVALNGAPKAAPLAALSVAPTLGGGALSLAGRF